MNACPRIVDDGAMLGGYELLELLATDDTCEQYLARRGGIAGFETYAVLYRLHPRLATRHAQARAFALRAQTAAGIQHRNIARVHDAGRVGDELYFAREYLHAETVRSVLERTADQSEALPLAHGLAIVAAVASAVHYLHSRSVASHLDLSPGNVVVTYSGCVKLIDVGVGRHKGRSAMPHRRERRERTADLVALGALAFELTTGQAWSRDGARARRRPSAYVPGYPTEVERIVMTALDGRASQRFSTARELCFAIEKFASTRGLFYSESRLASLMTSLFGHRAERWVTRSAPPRAPTPATVSAVPRAVERDRAPTDTWARSHADSEGGQQQAAALPRARRRGGLVAAALLLTACVVLGYLPSAVTVRSDQAPSATATPPPQRGSDAALTMSDAAAPAPDATVTMLPDASSALPPDAHPALPPDAAMATSNPDAARAPSEREASQPRRRRRRNQSRSQSRARQPEPPASPPSPDASRPEPDWSVDSPLLPPVQSRKQPR